MDAQTNTLAMAMNQEEGIDSNRQNEVITISTEMLSIVGGGEGMICIG